MSVQIAAMKVLSSYPAGAASLADLKRDLAILATSGSDWSQRMKRLAGRAPSLDAFSQGYIIRDATGWSITISGREFLDALERPLPEIAVIEPILFVAASFAVPLPMALPMKIVGRKDRKFWRRRLQRNVARMSA